MFPGDRELCRLRRICRMQQAVKGVRKLVLEAQQTEESGISRGRELCKLRPKLSLDGNPERVTSIVRGAAEVDDHVWNGVVVEGADFGRKCQCPFATDRAGALERQESFAVE